MAKTQRYFENNKPEHYEEGPWVLCGPFEDGTYRVERLSTTAPCSTTPASDTCAEFQYRTVMAARGLDPFVRRSFDVLAPVVDQLNRRV